MAHTFGWKRPKLGPHPMTSYRLARGVPLHLPPTVDLRSIDLPIEDQTDLGACTSFGWGAAVKFRQKNELNVACPSASHLFIYFSEREIEGTTADDAGAAVADGAAVVSALGVPPEEDWPYETSQYAVRPPLEAYADALPNRVPAPLSIDNTDINEVKGALARKSLIVFGFTVQESFESVRSDGIYRPEGGVIGGHCVAAVGYTVLGGSEVVICRNSWNTAWGAQGYFYMPLDFFQSSMVADLWTIPASGAVRQPTLKPMPVGDYP